MPRHESLILEGGPWRVTIERAGDRLAHRVDVRQGAGWRELLASIEGATDDVWPASPPLQELHTQTHGVAAPLALLVGMAGKSHWSLSASVQAAGETALFDVACRARAAAEFLGSTYRLAAGIAVEQLDERSALLRSADATWRIEASATLAIRGERLTIRPEIPALAPATVCWRYGLVRQGA